MCVRTAHCRSRREPRAKIAHPAPMRTVCGLGTGKPVSDVLVKVQTLWSACLVCSQGLGRRAADAEGPDAVATGSHQRRGRVEAIGNALHHPADLSDLIVIVHESAE